MMTTSRSFKPITDTGNGPDFSMTSVNRPDQEPSNSNLSPRPESLVDPQIACVLFLAMCVLWSQLLFPLALNSKTLFEAIMDAKDQAASSPTYIRWLNGLFSDEEELNACYSLHSFYVWHITNPSEILEQGFKPKLEEMGAFGYIKRTTKYNARFSTDDWAKVTYRSWTVYEPIDDPEDCKRMFFRMGKARLWQGIPDCDGTMCNCVDDSQEVTVVNPPFLSLLQRYKPTGLLSSLSQEVSANIKEGMTLGFVRATKAYLLPAVLRDVYQFRKAFLTTDKVLRSIFTSISITNGTATAVSNITRALSLVDTQASVRGIFFHSLKIRRALLDVGGTLSQAELSSEYIFDNLASQLNSDKVIHNVYGAVLEVNRTGSNKHLWHSAERVLPYDLGMIENPIFAAYPGGSWENESFQKTASTGYCTGGCYAAPIKVLPLAQQLHTNVVRFAPVPGLRKTYPAGRCGAMDQMRHDGRIGDTSLYHGNESLLAADGTESWLEVYGTEGTQDTPRKWEGFGEYKLTYILRSAGLESLGNDTVYPTRYLAEESVTLEIDIRLNRYVAQAQGWMDERERMGNDILTDFNGMTYMVPMGMVSTQLLTGYETFISDPHFLTNDFLDQQAAEQMNYIAPYERLHQSHVDIEPVTCKFIPKLLFRLERSAFSTSLMSSESSAAVCRSPTRNTFADGTGCFMYVPILWLDDQRVMDPASGGTLQEEFLFFVGYVADTAWKGLIASSTLAVLGGVLWSVLTFFKTKHDRRVWID